MLMGLTIIFTLYIALRLYISVMHIGYIDSQKEHPVLMSASEYLVAARYAIAKERVAMVGAMLEYLLFFVWVGGGLAFLERHFWLDGTLNGAFLGVMAFMVVNVIVTLPLGIYQTFGIDSRFGFNKSTVGLFVKDTLISWVIGTVAIYGIVAVVWLIIESSSLWWLYTFTFLLGVIVLLNILFPVVRALFFDKLSPIVDETLKSRLESLFAASGFNAQGLYVSDASRRDSRLNAYFAGLGRQKRVVLYDTLIAKLSVDEIVAVLGHELGHFRHGDIYKNIALTGGLLFVVLAVFGNLPLELFSSMGIDVSTGATMVLFLLLSNVLFFALMPIMGRVSRAHEFAADAYGSQLGGQVHLVSALKKLVIENRAFPRAHPLYNFFYATHPPVLERFKAMGVEA